MLQMSCFVLCITVMGMDLKCDHNSSKSQRTLKTSHHDRHSSSRSSLFRKKLESSVLRKHFRSISNSPLKNQQKYCKLLYEETNCQQTSVLPCINLQNVNLFYFTITI